MEKSAKNAARRYRRALDLAEQRRLEMNHVIREEHSSGKTLRQIAAETGHSFARVGQIVREG